MALEPRERAVGRARIETNVARSNVVNRDVGKAQLDDCLLQAVIGGQFLVELNKGLVGVDVDVHVVPAVPVVVESLIKETERDSSGQDREDARVLHLDLVLVRLPCGRSGRELK